MLDVGRMTATSHHRGHPTYYDEQTETWRYQDTDEPTSIERPCKRCGRLPTPEGHDACIGHVNGLSSACCGHGVKEPVFVLEGSYLDAVKRLNKAWTVFCSEWAKAFKPVIEKLVEFLGDSKEEAKPR